MKQFLKKVSPFNNSTDMSIPLFVVKKIFAFWVCYIAGLLVAELALSISFLFPLFFHFSQSVSRASGKPAGFIHFGMPASAATTVVLAFAAALIFDIGRKRAKRK